MSMKPLQNNMSIPALALAAVLSGWPAGAGDAPEQPPSQPALTVAGKELAAPAHSWQLPSEARVDSSGIFLNQIVNANPPVALPRIRLAPAPSLGQTIFLSRDQVLALARTNVAGMSASNWTGPARVRVVRLTRELGEVEMTGLLRATLQRDYVKDLGELELGFARPYGGDRPGRTAASHPRGDARGGCHS